MPISLDQSCFLKIINRETQARAGILLSNKRKHKNSQHTIMAVFATSVRGGMGNTAWANKQEVRTG
jgi:co-chaperonin GroES (HSP10)